MRYLLITVCLWLFFHTTCMAQLYKDKDKYHLGMKVSSTFNSLRGTELENPTIKMNVNGGVFFKYKLGQNFHLQTEVLASFKGSKFDNGRNRYERIHLFYLDFPLYAQVNLQKGKANHVAFLGPQVSYLLNSEVYVNGGARSLYKDLGLYPIDFAGVLGYQHNGYYTGFQICLKAGLRNINNGLKFVDVLPETGKGGSIYTVGLECGFLF